MEQKFIDKLKFDDYIETPTLDIVLKELVPSVRVRKRNDSYRISITDIDNDQQYKDPLILVDDVPIFDIDKLLKIPPKEIEKIEVHYRSFYLRNYIINGIVLIRTHTDNLGGLEIPKSSMFFEYQTVSPSYNLKTQDYSSSVELNSRKADFRTLLNWNPLIEENTDSLLNFYTSDQTGDYETYIFGTCKNGQAFHLKLFDLKVKE